MSEIHFGFQLLEQKIGRLLKPLIANSKFSKKEILIINNLVKNWEKIVGEKYSTISYPKIVNLSKKNGQIGETKLTIAVFNSAAAFALKNNAELILERIAMLYGYKVINKIIIKQEPKDIDYTEKSVILSHDQEEELQKKFQNIENQELATVLKKIDVEFLKK